MAALIVAISGFVGLYWQRRIDQRRAEEESVAARIAAAEKAEAAENERTKLINTIETERLSGIKADLEELRKRLATERDAFTAQIDRLRTRLTEVEAENIQLRRQMREAIETRDRRITELEARVAHLEAENAALKGGA